ncbi:MAG: tryptophan 7-halogenase [Anaerolineales bacterium]|nr:tryptophan 7-halogenase [Anaerolineales bacterium]
MAVRWSPSPSTGARRRGAPALGEHIEAEAVIDASGQRGVIGKQLDLRRVVDDMRCVATYAYYDNMAGVPGPLSRHVQWVVSIDDGWCWFIPVSPTRTSVGVVSRQKGLMALGDFEEALRAAGFPLDGATASPGRAKTASASPGTGRSPPAASLGRAGGSSATPPVLWIRSSRAALTSPSAAASAPASPRCG